jgi:hypothetical protein
MTYGLAFWVLMLIWVVFGLAWNWPGTPVGAYGPIGNALLLFFLLLLLGLHDFGSALHP